VVVGWVERSETHQLQGKDDGFRAAQPILLATRYSLRGRAISNLDDLGIGSRASPRILGKPNSARWLNNYSRLGDKLERTTGTGS
jgi:hypothetical protein